MSFLKALVLSRRIGVVWIYVILKGSLGLFIRVSNKSAVLAPRLAPGMLTVVSPGSITIDSGELSKPQTITSLGTLILFFFRAFIR